ncbi:DUF2062 domain-containing protein [Pararhizobium haloflavum]|uniref:DUF2062 domain-containing protein n=1 Tax=Pararhizobium haloflavum TaxID=2037914 RepID=UPI000C194BD7|nr:DUF2062 domain-containing protein [Pararhizobium haloflavum]
MLFRRRKKLGLWERFRLFIWPQRSFSRSIQYFAKRVLRLRATPHAIAAGVAAGVFASWTPLIGFHFVLSFAIAYVVAGNMIAAGIGTAVGNPLTFPFIWAGTFKLGHWILDRGKDLPPVHIDLVQLIRDIDFNQLWTPVIQPMLVGCLAPGLISALFFYVLTYWAVQRFQDRRRRLLADGARRRNGALPAGAATVGGEKH